VVTGGKPSGAGGDLGKEHGSVGRGGGDGGRKKLPIGWEEVLWPEGLNWRDYGPKAEVEGDGLGGGG